ncbi:hypothetical protein CNMCM6106_002507 [Aspergillus hiratsukae]|uniref:C2H2-type domain-containing protein n=1 Tax=Aspergillus hiratsukae TaxID=1194566 RepID=A0A8H6Q6V0_9EURO|nr:hypothetical protein CNMCM6106_002507 [Aspergillus hiratsukae]
MQKQTQAFPHRVNGPDSNSSSMPFEAKSMIYSSSANFFPHSATHLSLPATAGSPPRTPYYTQEHEKPNIGPNLRPFSQMPSESTTSVRHITFDHPGHEHGQTGTFRERPADDQSGWPTLDNHSRSETHDLTIKSLLNPSPSPPADNQSSNTCDVTTKSPLNPPSSGHHTEFAQGNEDKPNSSRSEAIFQDLLSIAKLLIPSKSTPETSLPNTKYKCIKCSGQYSSRFTLRRHFETTHLLRIWFTCPECPSFRAFEEDELRNHVTYFHFRGLTQDDIDACSNPVVPPVTLEEHMQDPTRRAVTAPDPQLRTLEQTLDSFKSRIIQEFPKLTPSLVDRLARAQLRRFGIVVENMENHAADLGSCKAGDGCFTKSLPSQIIKASQGRTIITTPYSLPLEKLPSKFECPYCLQIQEIRTSLDWRDHFGMAWYTVPFKCLALRRKPFGRKALGHNGTSRAGLSDDDLTSLTDMPTTEEERTCTKSHSTAPRVETPLPTASGVPQTPNVTSRASPEVDRQASLDPHSGNRLSEASSTVISLTPLLTPIDKENTSLHTVNPTTGALSGDDVSAFGANLDEAPLGERRPESWQMWCRKNLNLADGASSPLY